MKYTTWKKTYRPIIRNRDEEGRVLTYTTTTESGIGVEYNTLKEARLMAMIIE